MGSSVRGKWVPARSAWGSGGSAAHGANAEASSPHAPHLKSALPEPQVEDVVATVTLRFRSHTGSAAGRGVDARGQAPRPVPAAPPPAAQRAPSLSSTQDGAKLPDCNFSTITLLVIKKEKKEKKETAKFQNESKVHVFQWLL